MGEIIAVVNQKGGVGKTTTAVNLCAGLHAAGKRVLLCDFDPQANATSGMGVDKRKVKASVYQLLTGERTAAEVRKTTPYGDLLPATPALAGAGVELAGVERREFVLRDAISPGQLVPGLETDGSHVTVDRKMCASLPGCFAAGDMIRSFPYRKGE